jgi:hypothetical protein
METLTLSQIKAQYPQEWVLIEVDELKSAPHNEGKVLLHGTDLMELSYKGSELFKDYFTKIIYTGEKLKNRKWLKSIRLSEHPKIA